MIKLASSNHVRGFAALLLVFAAAQLRADLPPAAQEAVDKGVIAAKAEDYLLAVRYFQDARKLTPDAPDIFYNLGLAESKIPGHELRSICWFGVIAHPADGRAHNRHGAEVENGRLNSTGHRLVQAA